MLPIPTIPSILKFGGPLRKQSHVCCACAVHARAILTEDLRRMESAGEDGPRLASEAAWETAVTVTRAALHALRVRRNR